jgi:hypothetical protein
MFIGYSLGWLRRHTGSDRSDPDDEMADSVPPATPPPPIRREPTTSQSGLAFGPRSAGAAVDIRSLQFSDA